MKGPAASINNAGWAFRGDLRQAVFLERDEAHNDSKGGAREVCPPRRAAVAAVRVGSAGSAGRRHRGRQPGSAGGVGTRGAGLWHGTVCGPWPSAGGPGQGEKGEGGGEGEGKRGREKGKGKGKGEGKRGRGRNALHRGTQAAMTCGSHASTSAPLRIGQRKLGRHSQIPENYFFIFSFISFLLEEKINLSRLCSSAIFSRKAPGCTQAPLGR